MKLVLVVTAIFAQLINAQTWHSFEGYEYIVVYTPYVNKYQLAEAGCAAQNATVANVKTNETQNFLVKLIGNLTNFPYSLYIGAKRMGNTNNFQWTDGTRVNVEFWESGEPNNHNENEDCVLMGRVHSLDPSYKWNDVPCSRYSSRYICQRCDTACIPTTTTAQTTSPKPSITTMSSTASSTSAETSIKPSPAWPCSTITLAQATSPKQNTITSTLAESTSNKPTSLEVTMTKTSQTIKQSTSDDKPDNHLMFLVIGATVGCVFGATLMTILCILCRKRERSETKNRYKTNKYGEIGTSKQSEKANDSSALDVRKTEEAHVANNTAIVRASYISSDDTIVVGEKCVQVKDKEESTIPGLEANPHDYAAISGSDETAAYATAVVEKNSWKVQKTKFTNAYEN